MAPSSLLCPLLFVGFIIAVVLLGRYFERRRTAGLAAVAGQLGFAFSADEDESLIGQMDGLPLAEGGRDKTARNIMSGQVDETEILIFDYSYVTGSGKHRHTTAQSVMFLRWPGSELPRFSLQPEGMFHKLSELLGYNDIDFDSHPQFSKRYLLRGANAAAVREMFTDEVLAIYEAKNGLYTEAAGNVLLFYRLGKRVKPQELGAFYEEGWTAYAAIRRLSAAAGSTT